MAGEILYGQKGKVAVITINREWAVNALTPESAKQLGNAWKRFRDDESAWVAIITGVVFTNSFWNWLEIIIKLGGY